MLLPERSGVTEADGCSFWGSALDWGPALVWDKTLMPLELGDIAYREKYIIENYLGIPGMALLGEKKWKRVACASPS